MTREDIIRMAQESGIRDSMEYDHMECDAGSLERFATLVVAAEREEIAQMFDEEIEMARDVKATLKEDSKARLIAAGAIYQTEKLAAAIRAREDK